MNKVNEDYWYNQWHLDTELHNAVNIKNVTPVSTKEEVSIYADTDSLFVSFKPAMDHCEWKNLFNKEYINSINEEFIVLLPKTSDRNDDDDIFAKSGSGQSNSLCLGEFNYHNQHDVDKFEQIVKSNPNILIISDGHWINDYKFGSYMKENNLNIRWNWTNELDFIHGLDKKRYAGYFKKCLEEHAADFGVDNRQDFELERISEAIINIAKKKYIQHIVYEDGIPYDRLNYIYPKGVELVRSSTPLFARDKIVGIVKYLFTNPDTFNIRELLKLVKNLKKEFDLCVPDRIDEICMQSSCNKYEEKVLDDKDKLTFVPGAHFAVKASAYHNYLLNKNKSLQSKYEFIKSGSKIKYYYCQDKTQNDIFAYTRGAYPIEIAPEIDLSTQFDKCILSPINSIISPLGLPEITKRLSVVMDVFGGGFTLPKPTEPDMEDEFNDFDM